MEILYHNITKCILNVESLKNLVEVSDSGDFISMTQAGSPAMKRIDDDELLSVIKEWREEHAGGKLYFQIN